MLNSSPVSSNLPIIPVYTNEVNVFRIVGLDDETPASNLRYRSLYSSLFFFFLIDHYYSYTLGIGMDLGGAAQNPPTNFAVSSDGTVTFNTAGKDKGLWTAQVRISDGISYSVVDFLLDNMVRQSLFCLIFIFIVFVCCLHDI